ncbi:MAG: VWA domain-containing protein [Chloroflexota bacterium]
MGRRPGGELATRPLHFIWIADCSGSMKSHGKIQSLNTAIREAIPHMQSVADENPNARVLVRAIKFADGAQWHLGDPTPIADFRWTDLSADGQTDMGKALTMLADQLKIPPMSERALPPVLVLISDGQPTDNFQRGLDALMAQPWGKKAVRIAIAIGEDADHDVLQAFIGNPELKPLQANTPEALVRQIKWVSTAVLQAASAPASQSTMNLAPGAVIPLPALPAPSDSGPDKADDVW